MSAKLQLILALLAHNFGSVLLLGTLFYAQVAYLPAVAEVRTAQRRMRLRLEILSMSFRWIWAGVLLIYGSSLWALIRGDLFGLPVHVAWKGGLSVVLLLILLLAQLGLLAEARDALATDRVKQAHAWYIRLRVLLGLALLLALVTFLLGVSGAVLV